jgi:hypothetical protein
MPTILKTKNSVTTTVAPTSLAQGELAVNIADRKMWVGNAATTPVQLFGAGADGSFVNLAYTGTLTGGTGVIAIGTNQFYKDSSGNVMLGTTTARELLTVNKNAAFGTTSDAFSEIRFYNSTSTAGTTRLRADAGNLAFYLSNAEQMRIDTSGNLTVGATSGTGRINLAVASGGGWFSAKTGATSENLFGSDSTGNASIFTTGGTNTIALYTSGSERMRIDNNGNVGIGVTPSAWSISNGEALQISNTVAIWNFANTNAYFSNNLYFNGTNRIFLTNGWATEYSQAAGTHVWSVSSVSGTAGGTATMNESMRIDSSGNLLVGTTSSLASTKLSVVGATNGMTIQCGNGSVGGYMTNTSGTGNWTPFSFNNNGTSFNQIGSISTTSVATLYNTTSDYRLKTVIAPVANAGQRIDALEPIEYDFKVGGRNRGFLAHKFAEVYPNSVSGEKDAVDAEGKPIYQAMQASSSEVMADLIAEIQSLRKRVAQLESK